MRYKPLPGRLHVRLLVLPTVLLLAFAWLAVGVIFKAL
jgi:hypothetical protein